MGLFLEFNTREVFDFCFSALAREQVAKVRNRICAVVAAKVEIRKGAAIAYPRCATKPGSVAPYVQPRGHPVWNPLTRSEPRPMPTAAYDIAASELDTEAQDALALRWEEA